MWRNLPYLTLRAARLQRLVVRVPGGGVFEEEPLERRVDRARPPVADLLAIQPDDGVAVRVAGEKKDLREAGEGRVGASPRGGLFISLTFLKPRRPLSAPRMYLGCTSAAPRLHLGCISVLRPHLGGISPDLPRREEVGNGERALHVNGKL